MFQFQYHLRNVVRCHPLDGQSSDDDGGGGSGKKYLSWRCL